MDCILIRQVIIVNDDKYTCVGLNGDLLMDTMDQPGDA